MGKYEEFKKWVKCNYGDATHSYRHIEYCINKFDEMEKEGGVKTFKTDQWLQCPKCHAINKYKWTMGVKGTIIYWAVIPPIVEENEGEFKDGC